MYDVDTSSEQLPIIKGGAWINSNVRIKGLYETWVRLFQVEAGRKLGIQSEVMTRVGMESQLKTSKLSELDVKTTSSDSTRIVHVARVGLSVR